jgi:hypothetical protein
LSLTQETLINLFKLCTFYVLWVLFLIIKVPVALLGFLVIPLVWPFRNTPYDDLPAWTRPWANPEDWHGQINHYEASLPRWWVNKHGTGFKSFYQYHAVRNPANGLRSYEWIDLDIVPENVRYQAKPYLGRYEPSDLRERGLKVAKYWAWIGPQAGYKYIRIWNDKRHMVVKFGWRVEPSDRNKEPNELKKDASFASKILFYRKG